MTENSTDRTSAAGFLLLLFLLAIACLVYFFQAEHKKVYEGLYPAVKPMIQGHFHFGFESVVIKLSRDPLLKRIVIFAYDENENQVCIIKPVHHGRVTIFSKDFPDFRVKIRDSEVRKFDVVKKIDGVTDEENFYTHLIKAKQSFRKYGVQECLYPFCTRCLDVCPVVKFGIIEMCVTKDGRFNPVIHFEGCPRCGKCFEVCKAGIIVKLSDLPPDKHKAPPDGNPH